MHALQLFLPGGLYICISIRLKGLSVFKKLAGEAALYGLSSILARFVNFILVPIHTKVFKEVGNYGIIGQVFGWTALGITLYSFRMESAYFRYASNDAQSKSYANAKSFVLLFVIIATAAILFFADRIAGALHLEGYSYLVRLGALIVGLDALCELPFARLRLQKRPIKFVSIKICSICINVLLNVYFLLVVPNYHFPGFDDPLAAVFVANLIASACTFLLLQKEYFFDGFQWSKDELFKIIKYTWPLLIVGLSGNIDDAMSRQFIGWFATGDVQAKKIMMGEYNACVKFAVFITLFVQAFRYAAEPFFFKHMHSDNAKSDYSKITTYFTQFLMIGFVTVLLYLEFIQHFIVQTPAYLNAIGIVPIVLMANVLFGIYYNVSNWYRLTDKTEYGMYSAVIGVAITLVFNILLVPRYGYYGTAISLLLCYSGMTVVTYIWGQRFYPIEYETLKIFLAILSGVGIYILHLCLKSQFEFSTFIWFCISTALLVLYVLVFNLSLLKILFKRPA